ncbi:MAG: amidase family protein [Rhizomicrobium sp.]
MTNGSALLQGYVSDVDGELTRRYRAAGMVLFGKTNTPEFGIPGTTEGRFLGNCHNPWNPDHSTGGSSGGAAAAGGERHRADGACLGRPGLDPHSGGAMRLVRHEADPVAQSGRAGRPRPRPWPGGRPCRDPHGARQRRDARLDRLSRGRRALRAGAQDPSVYG